MNISYGDSGQPFATITCDTPKETSVIRLALDRLASDFAHESAAENRRDARTAYEALCGSGDTPTDDFYRSARCTGGQWCRCPVTTPCPQRGDSHITGFSADSQGVHRLTDARG